MKLTNLLSSLALLAATLLLAPAAQAALIDTAPVGNPGNLADDTGRGAVAYGYRIGKTEVTNAQYVEFLNAVATLGDSYGLYNANMGGNSRGGITRTGAGTLGDPYVYAVKTPALSGAYVYDDKPVNYVSWGDAVRFANWLHNDRPTTGVQNAGTTEDGAYTLGGATSQVALSAVTRNAVVARWWIPNEDEWYKAAYHKNDGATGNYWDYPTGTDNTGGELNNNLPSADTGDSANFFWDSGYTTGNSSYPLTDAGAYVDSYSPYGTFDQGGNVQEWNETLVNDFYRSIRGGAANLGSNNMLASSGIYDDPTNEGADVGFRVATIPEPSAICLAAPALLFAAATTRARARRRKAKAGDLRR